MGPKLTLSRRTPALMPSDFATETSPKKIRRTHVLSTAGVTRADRLRKWCLGVAASTIGKQAIVIVIRPAFPI
jgi:hypothetical protein